MLIPQVWHYRWVSIKSEGATDICSSSNEEQPQSPHRLLTCPSLNKPRICHWTIPGPRDKIQAISTFLLFEPEILFGKIRSETVGILKFCCEIKLLRINTDSALNSCIKHLLFYDPSNIFQNMECDLFSLFLRSYCLNMMYHRVRQHVH